VGCPTPPRFRSQVFSTSQRLPSSPGLRGLVPCRNRSWDSSLQSLPLAEIAHPSRGHVAPLPLSTDRLGRVTGVVSPPVSPTPTLFSAVAWFPRRLWAPFRHARRHASRSPWTPSGETVPFRQLHRLRSLDPPASPFAPAQVSLNRRPMLSWVSAPLELSPPTPWILRPVLPRGSDTRSRPRARARSSQDLAARRSR
jgi:hypothetical protein